jgi:hypothetical protein
VLYSCDWKAEGDEASCDRGCRSLADLWKHRVKHGAAYSQHRICVCCDTRFPVYAIVAETGESVVDHMLRAKFLHHCRTCPMRRRLSERLNPTVHHRRPPKTNGSARRKSKSRRPSAPPAAAAASSG